MEEKDYYGAKYGIKARNSWRILRGNIGTLPNERTGKGKEKIDKWKVLATREVDVNMLCE